MAVQGRLYGISVDGDFVNCEIACSISVSRELLTKSGRTGGQARQFRYGAYTWQIDLDARSVVSILKGSFNSLLEAQLEGRELEVFIMARQTNIQEIKIGGTVLIPDLSISFPNSGYSSYNVTFKGSGLLSHDIETLYNIINSMPADADKPLVIDTSAW